MWQFIFCVVMYSYNGKFYYTLLLRTCVRKAWGTFIAQPCAAMPRKIVSCDNDLFLVKCNEVVVQRLVMYLSAVLYIVKLVETFSVDLL